MNPKAPDVRLEIEPRVAALYNEFVKQTAKGVTELAPEAAHRFLAALPYIRNDLWLSRVIAVASKSHALDLSLFDKLHCPGPLSAVQIYDLHAKGLHFDTCTAHKEVIIDAAVRGQLGREELSLISIRTLLHEANQFEQAQLAFTKKQYPDSVRQPMQGGSGIWLGATATVKSLAPALESILQNSSSAHADNLGLVLVSSDGQINQDVLEVAKQFKRAFWVKYLSEQELVQRLRDLKMRVLIEMHGLQNPVSFIDSLRFGVAEVQLTWAGLPESCAVPFIDGQLVDSVLAQATSASCRSIPLRSWIPPINRAPKMVRGTSLGIWASTTKLTESFLAQAMQMADASGRRLQIFTGHDNSRVRSLPANIELVHNLGMFQPAVLLDTYPLSGGNACLIALQNGIPVVTLAAANISSRLGASVLYNHGFSQGVASSPEHYRKLAMDLLDVPPMNAIPKTMTWEFVSTVENFFPQK